MKSSQLGKNLRGGISFIEGSIRDFVYWLVKGEVDFFSNRGRQCQVSFHALIDDLLKVIRDPAGTIVDAFSTISTALPSTVLTSPILESRKYTCMP